MSLVDITFPLTLYVPLLLGLLTAARYAIILFAALAEIRSFRLLMSAAMVEMGLLGCRLVPIPAGFMHVLGALACKLLVACTAIQLDALRRCHTAQVVLPVS